jgi:hypothetical protein
MHHTGVVVVGGGSRVTVTVSHEARETTLTSLVRNALAPLRQLREFFCWDPFPEAHRENPAINPGNVHENLETLLEHRPDIQKVPLDSPCLRRRFRYEVGRCTLHSTDPPPPRLIG